MDTVSDQRLEISGTLYLTDDRTAGCLPLWAVFDEDWYRKRYPETEEMLGKAGGQDAELFYHEQGVALGHSPNPYFDEAFYLSVTPQARAAIANGEFRSGLEHFRLAADKGDMPHWLFSETYYRKSNPDLNHAEIIDEFGGGYGHYLAHGDREWRQGHPFFDPALYIANMSAAALKSDVRSGPFRHFLTRHDAAGSNVRLSWYFDPEWYLDTYPNVADETEAGHWSSSLEHYLCNLRPGDYNPLAEFSESFYLKQYPDVRKAVEQGRYRNGYTHFVTYGALENRKPHPDIDLGAYFVQGKIQADITNGRYRDAFAHFIAARQDPASGRIVPNVSEEQSREIARRVAESLLPKAARRPLDFTVADTASAVAVIMVVHNRFELTLAALNALRSCHRGDIELHIADSGSTDESRNLDRYVRGADIIHYRQNIGFVDGCNNALGRVRAPYVLILNNDITLDYGAVDAALGRIRSEEDIGAVGGKVIRTNGLLQEAGCIVWRDGSTTGYLRGEDPNIPEANFVRDVDFCSAVFLLIRTPIAQALGGFDTAYRPGYFEETDLCLRLVKAGYRVVYDPEIIVRHYEYGSSSRSSALRAMDGRHWIFQQRHRNYLRSQYPYHPEMVTHARSPQRGLRRILVIEDRIPLRQFGSGFTRSNDIVRAMASLGHQVTVYPIYRATENLAAIYGDFPETVEVIHDRGLDELAGFLANRVGYYDVLWIARTHNAERVTAVIQGMPQGVPINRIILDTEAVAAARSYQRDVVLERPRKESLEAAIARELTCADFCQKLVAVNELDAQMIRDAGFEDVDVLGHTMRPSPTPRRFEERQGLLFLGAIGDHQSPNLDALVWFVTVVLPLLEQALPPQTQFTIAGYVNRLVDLTPLTRRRNVRLIGPVNDLPALYDQHRVFVAPLRFAAGISYKLHEAAAHGLPIVASDLLRQQLGWVAGRDMMCADSADPAQFATNIREVYDDESLWTRLRESALQRIREENDGETYRASLKAILDPMLEPKPRIRVARYPEALTHVTAPDCPENRTAELE